MAINAVVPIGRFFVRQVSCLGSKPVALLLCACSASLMATRLAIAIYTAAEPCETRQLATTAPTTPSMTFCLSNYELFLRFALVFVGVVMVAGHLAALFSHDVILIGAVIGAEVCTIHSLLNFSAALWPNNRVFLK